jgi:hypothetical protein
VELGADPVHARIVRGHQMDVDVDDAHDCIIHVHSRKRKCIGQADAKEHRLGFSHLFVQFDSALRV